MTIYRDQLQAVYKLIEKPEHWTQHADARISAEGPMVRVDDDRATCWCLVGGFIKTGGQNIDAFRGALGISAMGGANRFNDTHTHAEVLALLRSAIERAPVRP